MSKIDIFAQAEQRNIIFKNKDVLNPTFVSDDSFAFLYRDRQLAHLGRGLRPILTGKEPTDFLLYGIDGTGKTTAAKLAGSQIKSRLPNSTIVYAEPQRTSEISLLSLLNSEISPDKSTLIGLSIEDAQRKLRWTVTDCEVPLVIILDCIDSLGKKASDVVRGLKEIKESKKDLSIIAITDQQLVDLKTSSIFPSYQWESLDFEPYDSDQLKDILAKRARIALADNALDKNVLDGIVRLTEDASRCDVGYALRLLKRAGEIASNEDSPKITMDHLTSTIKDTRYAALEQNISKMNAYEKLAVKALLQTGAVGSPVKSTLVYEVWEDLLTDAKMDILTYRSFSNLIKKLNTNGIVESRIKYTGRNNGKRGGNYQEVVLAVDQLHASHVLQLYPVKG